MHGQQFGSICGAGFRNLQQYFIGHDADGGHALLPGKSRTPRSQQSLGLRIALVKIGFVFFFAAAAFFLAFFRPVTGAVSRIVSAIGPSSSTY